MGLCGECGEGFQHEVAELRLAIGARARKDFLASLAWRTQAYTQELVR